MASRLMGYDGCVGLGGPGEGWGESVKPSGTGNWQLPDGVIVRVIVRSDAPSDIVLSLLKQIRKQIKAEEEAPF